jgi:hypothetical protein
VRRGRQEIEGDEDGDIHHVAVRSADDGGDHERRDGEGEKMEEGDDVDDIHGGMSAIPGYGEDEGIPIVHGHISGDRGVMSGMALPTVTTPLISNPETRDRSLYPFSPSIGYSTKPSPTTPFSTLFGEEEWVSSAPPSRDRSKPPLPTKKE